MQTKLTLRLEKNLIEVAKEWAEKNDVSLSQIASMVFKRLLPHKQEAAELHPFTRKEIKESYLIRM